MVLLLIKITDHTAERLEKIYIQCSSTWIVKLKVKAFIKDKNEPLSSDWRVIIFMSDTKMFFVV